MRQYGRRFCDPACYFSRGRASHEDVMRTVQYCCAVLLLPFIATTAGAQPLDKVSFGTNWVAEGEHGGYYQAVAEGTYRKYGLDVSIVPGGPNVNNRILVP